MVKLRMIPCAFQRREFDEIYVGLQDVPKITLQLETQIGDFFFVIEKSHVIHRFSRQSWSLYLKQPDLVFPRFFVNFIIVKVFNL